MKHWIMVLISSCLCATSSISEEKRAIVFAEAVSANGVRALIGHYENQSRTRLVITIPLQYVINKEKSWEQLSRDWVSANPTRELFQLPSERAPSLIVECDEVLDEGALYQLLQRFSNSSWTFQPQLLQSQSPTFAWFRIKEFRSANFPKANELMFGVISKQSIETSWRWVEQNTADWVGKIPVFRESSRDTNVSNSIFHRLGQQVDIIHFQPLTNTKIAFALNSESENKSISNSMEQEFFKRNIQVLSINTSTYPQLDPKYFYIQITGDIEHLNEYLSTWDVAWQEYLLSSSVLNIKPKQTIISIPNDDLEKNCLQRIYPRMTQIKSIEVTSEEIMNVIQNEKWSSIMFVDTTKFTPPMNYKIRKE